MVKLIRLLFCIVVTWSVADRAFSQDAPALKYDLKAGSQVYYRVSIVFDSPVEKHTMSGVIGYTGLENSGALKLKYQGGLSEKKQSKQSGRFGGPGRFGRRPGGPPPGLFNRSAIRFDGLKQTTSQLVLKSNGDVESLKAESHIPYLLGNLSLLPFESLPEKPESKWQAGNGITVTEQDDSSGSRSPFREINKTVKTGGSELSKYEVQKVDGDLVTIKKLYELHSPKVSDNDNAVDIVGSGTFVFNTKIAFPESLDMKYDYTVHVKETKISIPLTVNYQRMTEEEHAAHVAKQEFIKKNPGINTVGSPWTDEVQDNIIKELQSSDVHIVQRRLVRLSARLPFLEEKRVAEALHPLLSKGGQTGKMAGMAWRRWKVIVPELANAPVEKKMEAKPQDSESKPAANKLRFWSDKTGTFKVEAEFIELKADAVVLKRKKDGKVMTVPLTKLSDADQKVAKELGEAAKKPLPENPFE